MQNIDTFLSVTFAAFAILAVLWARFPRKHLFPGPMGIPIFGNYFQMPSTHSWRYYEKLYERYGPINRLSIANDELLILHELEDAEELLEWRQLGKRSSTYSSRKPLICAGKYQSNNKRLVLLSYGDTFRLHRQAFHHMVQPRKIGGYETIQSLESEMLLYNMLVAPEAAERNCQRYTASLVFHLSYGTRFSDDDDADLKTLLNILAGFIRDTFPGAHLVDSLPILDWLPDFLSPWRVTAKKRHVNEKKFYERLALNVKAEIDGGNQDLECFAARLWEQKEKLGLDLEDIAYVAGTAFEAGTDAASGTLMYFIMAMVLHQHVLDEAQAEIDALLGADGKVMPTFANMSALPFCAALVKEVFRWNTAAPVCFPHYVDQDDEYKGFHIPKHTLVMASIWSMNRRQQEFDQAEIFDPYRYYKALKDLATIDHNTLIEGHYSFGFGRRKCPGQYVGVKATWLAIVRLLWAFNIAPKHDSDGNVLPVDPEECTSGMTTRPLPFPYEIRVRSERHAQTIRDAYEK